MRTGALSEVGDAVGESTEPELSGRPRFRMDRPVSDRELLPKVTGYTLRRADAMCARRLAHEYEGGPQSSDPFHRSRMRDAFLAAARDCHAELAVPEPSPPSPASAPTLEPEERRVLAQAARWYVEIFGDRARAPARPRPRRSDRLARARRADRRVGRPHRDRRRRRQGAPPARPLGWPVARRRPAGARGRPPRGAAAVDVVRRRPVARDLGRPRARDRARACRRRRRASCPRSASWFDDRLAVVRRASPTRAATPGDDCGGCRYVSGCPGAPDGRQLRSAARPGARHHPPHTDVARRMAPVPARLARPVPAAGARRATATRRRRTGSSCTPCSASCTSRARAATLRTSTTCSPPTASTDDDRTRAEIANHVRRCPEGATALGHELTVARFHRLPLPMFMATARIDALWEHDGVLDARDYKTGRVWSDEVSARRAGAAAGLGARAARPASGLRLRIAFEHLASEVVDDPTPFEPDADDLAQIEEELRARGRRDPHRAASTASPTPSCARTAATARSARESAAPSEPVWPVVADEDAGRRRRRLLASAAWRALGRVEEQRAVEGHDAVARRHQAVRPVRQRAPVPRLVHDRRAVPAVRAALRARRGLLGGRARPSTSG